MKIAHVIYDLQVGGVANIITQLLSAERPGVEQILILLSESEKKEATKLLSNVKTYQLSYRPIEKYNLVFFTKLVLFPKKYFGAIAEQITEIWRKENFDIFHFHGMPQDLPIGALLQKKNNAVKLVYTDHMLRITQKEYQRITGKLLAWLYRRFYACYNCIFVSNLAKDMAEKAQFVNKKMHNRAIENSIPIKSFTAKSSYSIQSTIRIAYVSRISAVKGHFLLPKVAVLLKQKYNLENFEFVLIGPGELSEQLRQLVSAENLDKHFKFLGPMKGIAELLTHYDVGVFPSEREGLPVALLEKMATGLPVVASDISEIRNVIQNKDEALLFPVNNAEACAEQLYKLVQNEQLRRIIGVTARKAVEQRYSTPLLDKYIEFYNLLSKNNINN